jgi:hypothetical protein
VPQTFVGDQQISTVKRSCRQLDSSPEDGYCREATFYEQVTGVKVLFFVFPS